MDITDIKHLNINTKTMNEEEKELYEDMKNLLNNPSLMETTRNSFKIPLQKEESICHEIELSPKSIKRLIQWKQHVKNMKP